MTRRLLIASLVVVSGCATFDPQTYCSSDDPAVCAKLKAIAANLHTPEMDAAIAAAKPGVPRQLK